MPVLNFYESTFNSIIYHFIIFFIIIIWAKIKECCGYRLKISTTFILVKEFSFYHFWFERCTADSTAESHFFKQPCRVRMHYGHPDVFDRIFHISRGGISKASRVINISEDIYAGKFEEWELSALV